jgi:hypothetical protein
MQLDLIACELDLDAANFSFASSNIDLGLISNGE